MVHQRMPCVVSVGLFAAHPFWFAIDIDANRHKRLLDDTFITRSGTDKGRTRFSGDSTMETLSASIKRKGGQQETYQSCLLVSCSPFHSHLPSPFTAVPFIHPLLVSSEGVLSRVVS